MSDAGLEAQLPTSLSVYDKVSGFEAEALQKRDRLMERAFIRHGVEEQCKDMLLLMKEQTYSAEQRATRVGEPWRAQTTRSLEDAQLEQAAVAQRAEATTRIDQITTDLVERGIQAVRVDIAIGDTADDRSQVLVAYSIVDAEGEVNSDPDTQSQLATLFNDCLFAESQLVTQDSTIYQAKSLDKLIEDSQGNLVPGERQQIEQAFKRMHHALDEKGVGFELKDDYNYSQVKQQSTIEVPAAEVATPQVSSPTAPEPSSSKPEI